MKMISWRLARQRGGDLAGQGGDIVGLVLDRHDHGNGTGIAASPPDIGVLQPADGGLIQARLCNIEAGPT